MHTTATSIDIPAYDSFGQGLSVRLQIKMTPSQGFSIAAKGRVAIALQKNFQHVVEIMTDIKKDWGHLEYFCYALECHDQAFIVKDAKSSSMALSIALINAHRIIHNKPPIIGLTGTGLIRIDGSFEKTNLEDKKQLGAQTNRSINRFITANWCPHLDDLDKLIDLN